MLLYTSMVWNDITIQYKHTIRDNRRRRRDMFRFDTIIVMFVCFGETVFYMVHWKNILSWRSVAIRDQISYFFSFRLIFLV